MKNTAWKRQDVHKFQKFTWKELMRSNEAQHFFIW